MKAKMKFHPVTLLVLIGLTKSEPILFDLSPGYDLDPPSSHTVKVVEKGSDRLYIGLEMNQTCITEHKGAHLEAPVSFVSDLFLPSYYEPVSWSVENIPYQRLWRLPGVLMDASRKDEEPFEITAEQLEAWERESGLSIPSGGILLIKTGWVSKTELPIDEDGSNETLPRQPRLSEDAGVWLANYGYRTWSHNGIFAVGIDLDSLDAKDQNTSTSVRSKLFEKGIYALNNLKNLDMLPKSGFLVTTMPMKVSKEVGAPARVWAEREDTREEEEEADDSDEDETGYDWSREADYHSHGYPPERGWGYDGVDVPIMMSASASKVASMNGLCRVALVVMPVLVALMK